MARIAPNVSAQSRTLTVEAEIDNRSGALKPGQFATVRILQERQEPAVLVPARAVITEAGVSRVFVIKDGHIAACHAGHDLPSALFGKQVLLIQ